MNFYIFLYIYIHPDKLYFQLARRLPRASLVSTLPRGDHFSDFLHHPVLLSIYVNVLLCLRDFLWMLVPILPPSAQKAPHLPFLSGPLSCSLPSGPFTVCNMFVHFLVYCLSPQLKGKCPLLFTAVSQIPSPGLAYVHDQQIFIQWLCVWMKEEMAQVSSDMVLNLKWIIVFKRCSMLEASVLLVTKIIFTKLKCGDLEILELFLFAWKQNESWHSPSVAGLLSPPRLGFRFILLNQCFIKQLLFGNSVNLDWNDRRWW